MGNRRRKTQETGTSESNEGTAESAELTTSNESRTLTNEADLRRKKTRLLRDLRNSQNEVLSLIENSEVTTSQVSQISSELDKASDELLEIVEVMANSSSDGDEDHEDLWEEYDAVQRDISMTLRLANKSLRNAVSAVLDKRSNDSAALTREAEPRQRPAEETETRHPPEEAHADSPVDEEGGNCRTRQTSQDDRMRVDWANYGLKRPQLPVFAGEPNRYEDWRATFDAFVSIENVPGKFKMMQLKNCLAGDALKLADRYRPSDNGFSKAMDELERKYGGVSRRIRHQLEEIRSIRSVRPGATRDLEELADRVQSLVTNLEEYGSAGDLSDVSAYYILVKEKLHVTFLKNYRRWIQGQNKKDNFKTFAIWLREEAQYEQEALEMSSTTQVKKEEMNFKKMKKTWNTQTKESKRHGEKSCMYCEREHWLSECPLFQKWTVGSRYNYCKTKRICFRCLAGNHRGINCRKFPGCQVAGCGGSHHSLLHATRQDSSSDMRQGTAEARMRNPEDNEVDLTHRTAASATQSSSRVVFQTVPVKVKANGRSVIVNALLDPCSDANFLTDAASNELGLEGNEEPFELGNVNGSSQVAMKKAKVEICSTSGQFRTSIGAYVIKDLSGASTKIDWNTTKHKWNHLKNVPFPNVSRRQGIDMLLGLTECTMSLFIPLETKQGEAHEPVGVKTPLGWTAFGPVGVEDRQKGFSKTLRTHVSAGNQDEIDAIHAMTDLELLGVRNEKEKSLSYEEKSALQKAQNSLKYDGERYEVAVPWRRDQPDLRGNFGYALNRLKKTEQSLMKNEDTSLLAKYSANFEEYMSKGYMKKISPDVTELAISNSWFLPHFPVIRYDRATTKIRVVYDAAAKFLGKSLNDELYPGPSICNDLIEVLLGFRRHTVALTGDVAEMFLQVKLPDEDRKFHRVLWRNGEMERDPDIYEAQRWLFGNAAAPFAAQFAMKENAKQHASRFPLASDTVENSFYMDDALASFESEDEAKEARKQLTQLMKLAGMKIRKWRSNSSKVMDSIEEEDRAEEPSVIIENGAQRQTKTLGVVWNADKDQLSIGSSVTLQENISSRPKKRICLKTIAAIFDPLCLICPFTVRSKILFQETWSRGLEWDEELPPDMKRKWEDWVAELEHVSSLSVPRCIHSFSKVTVQKLHVFSDASEQAYAAAVYAVTEGEDGTSSNLALARVRVTPRSRKVSIPRLELMAALLGLRLVKKACAAFKIPISEVLFWSDSINVLCWIRNDVRQFQSFVAHRISEIREATNTEQWQHVPGIQNPADLPSRGVTLDVLKSSDLWWNGPPFLVASRENWPALRDLARELFDKSEMKQMRTTHAIVTTDIHTEFRLHPSHFSSWMRLVKVTAWVLRFTKNLKRRTRGQHSDEESPCTAPSLDRRELSSAESFWLLRAQECFREERSQLHAQEAVPSSQIKHGPVFKSSSIRRLCPILDNNGLLRVGGRLQRSALPFDARHPVLLPKGHHVTRLLVRHVHEQGDHEFGVEHTISELRQWFWIVSAREEVKKCVRYCPECIKRRKKPEEQLMAPKTESEVGSSCRAFSSCAVDFAGPFETKQGRGKTRMKRYLCVFLCMQSRTVHLEIAFGLDTDSFLRAFLRFVARRGKPSAIISDNGRNFVGANRELQALARRLDQDVIKKKTAHLYIDWRFIPPGAPHFNGGCEAIVKSAKRALKRTLEAAHLTDEELMTAFCRAEALLNSRPLTAVSSDPKDSPPLTPAAFLLGHTDVDVSPEDADGPENTRRRWRRLQQLNTEFWRRWIREYLPSLQGRQKWTEKTRNLRVGETVLIADPSVPRGSWPLARVTKTFPGQDGLVRVVEVNTLKGVYKRPVTKIVRLELDR